MKKLYISVCLALAALLLQAQIPAGFNYQAVIRNETGELVKNKSIGVRFTILKSTENGNQVYSEVIYPQTNINGLVTAEIGKSNPTLFSQIDWSGGIYFLKTETDLNGGTNYIISGVTQLMRVPYSMYAEKSGDGFSGNYNDLSNKPLLSTVATTGSYSDLLNTPNLATIATTGSFTDLLNVPILVTLLKNPQAGDILYNNGTNWELLTRGINGQTLRLDNGMPKWGEPGYALPMVTTNAATDVLQPSAISGGNVIATGYSDITARGVCWSTNQNPTVADSKTTEPVGIGTYTSKLTGLTANATYYARAYATNAAGTAYGNQISFKTFLTVVFPTVTTLDAGNVTEYSAASGGDVTATGGAEVTAKGICWSTNQNPTIADKKTNDGTGTGQFNSQMDNLNPGSTYYVRAYATNSSGTGYGNQVTLTALKTTPTVSTKNITDISAMGAVTGGTIPATGGSDILEKGICWGEFENPTVDDNKISAGTGATTFNSAIVTAVPGKTYYVRAYAQNEMGTVYGQQKSFTTLSNVNYYGFESGMKPAGWGGQWTVKNTKAFEGSYCLMSAPGITSETTLTITTSTAGQISFYHFQDWGSRYSNSYQTSIDFYIDDVKAGNFPASSGWNQGLFDVLAGTHTFKWVFNENYGGNGYIDYIVLPK